MTDSDADTGRRIDVESESYLDKAMSEITAKHMESLRDAMNKRMPSEAAYGTTPLAQRLYDIDTEIKQHENAIRDLEKERRLVFRGDKE